MMVLILDMHAEEHNYYAHLRIFLFCILSSWLTHYSLSSQVFLIFLPVYCLVHMCSASFLVPWIRCQAPHKWKLSFRWC